MTTSTIICLCLFSFGMGYVYGFIIHNNHFDNQNQTKYHKPIEEYINE